MKSIFFGTAMLAVVAGLYACSSSKTDTGTTIPTDDAGGHTSPYPSCNAITEACHEFDVGEGEIHDCHEIGHESTSDAPCAAAKDRCLALCVAEAGADAHGEDAGADAHADDAGDAH